MVLNFLARRTLALVPLLFGISLVLFSVIHLAPGGPLDFYADNPGVTPEALAEMKAALGLDQPLPVQYLRWVSSFLQGHWGYSIRTSRPVLLEITERLPATLRLGGTALLVAFLVALPLGIISAVKRYSTLDYVLTVISFSGIALPVFWLGMMLQLVFAVTLRWLPSGGSETIGDGSFTDRLLYMVMPVSILAFATIAKWARYMRASMIEVMRQDYIRTARAKGQSPRGVVVRHALRNALLPFVTVVALDLVNIFTGTVITEAVFTWPGIGSLFIQSMNARDYPVLMGIMMIGSLTLVLGNLLADLAYSLIDPRIQLR
ncbi:ABC transporter permease [Roseomonas sp. BN140053]|uniref:ABC transporter permease n=1 Tax=Roseomonas sp. BN140053 TaxID=3391898 RepID=UPI0039EC4E5B